LTQTFTFEPEAVTFRENSQANNRNSLECGVVIETVCSCENICHTTALHSSIMLYYQNNDVFMLAANKYYVGLHMQDTEKHCSIIIQ